jgi:hypothetical protein
MTGGCACMRRGWRVHHAPDDVWGVVQLQQEHDFTERTLRVVAPSQWSVHIRCHGLTVVRSRAAQGVKGGWSYILGVGCWWSTKVIQGGCSLRSLQLCALRSSVCRVQHASSSLRHPFWPQQGVAGTGLGSWLCQLPVFVSPSGKGASFVARRPT